MEPEENDVKAANINVSHMFKKRKEEHDHKIKESMIINK